LISVLLNRKKVFTVKWKINISEENCTGCRICQMICSWANEGGFYPSRSLITIENSDNEAHFGIRIDNGCKNCGLCATYCTSKALVKEAAGCLR
jgi:Pyruvate/2-oxoacid:ferredoxin oxidoreductase delta subunit